MRTRLLPRAFPPPEAPPTGSWRNPVLAAAALFVLVTALYWPATGFRLLAYDDAAYTLGNEVVGGGLDWRNVVRSFTELPEQHIYVPLADLSLMADVELFGMSPRGFHLTNVLLHGANMALLSLLLWRLTGSPWKAFAAAALVALHPMRVEPVAWVSERKGLLSSFFLLLAVACHLRHVRTGRRRWYALLVACFLLALLAKPTALVLPVLLLLLDAWPLGRFRPAEGGGSPAVAPVLPPLLEKVPLLALSIGVVALQSYQQAKVGAFHAAVPPLSRLEHALAAPFAYLYLTAWPPDLAVRFFDTSWQRFSGLLLPAAAATAVVTLLALREGERRPYLAFGWLWFVLFLFPTAGLTPLGSQWLSDRFAYLPHAGVAVALVWGVSGAVPAGRLRALLLPASGVAVAALLAFLSREQLHTWKDGATLFRHGLPYNGHDPAYRLQYVAELLGTGEAEEALGATGPLLPLAARRDGIGERVRLLHVRALEGTGDREGAVAAARRYLEAGPDEWKLRLLLADALLAGDRLPEAEREYRILLGAASPLPAYEHALVLEGLGIALAGTGREEGALAAYGEGLLRNPSSVSIRFNAALLLSRRGDRGGAAALLDEALAIEPGNVMVAREREALR